MALNTSTIDTEIALANGLQSSWRDYAKYCQAKIMEGGAAISGYTINGRSVTKDATYWERMYKTALEMASVENSGGIDEQPIRFIART
jgi:hypothetical protein